MLGLRRSQSDFVLATVLFDLEPGELKGTGFESLTELQLRTDEPRLVGRLTQKLLAASSWWREKHPDTDREDAIVAHVRRADVDMLARVWTRLDLPARPEWGSEDSWQDVLAKAVAQELVRLGDPLSVAEVVLELEVHVEKLQLESIASLVAPVGSPAPRRSGSISTSRTSRRP